MLRGLILTRDRRFVAGFDWFLARCFWNIREQGLFWFSFASGVGEISGLISGVRILLALMVQFLTRAINLAIQRGTFAG